jgi:hypothetical protein
MSITITKAIVAIVGSSKVISVGFQLDRKIQSNYLVQRLTSFTMNSISASADGSTLGSTPNLSLVPTITAVIVFKPTACSLNLAIKAKRFIN